MRTIKFRGKCQGSGEWKYGDLECMENGSLAMIREHNRVAFSVDPNTVGQFTGLHDADGKEIYEGDVIESGQGVRHCIKYDDTQAQFIGCGKHSVECGVYDAWIARFHKRVIGNMHDNPELIEWTDTKKY